MTLNQLSSMTRDALRILAKTHQVVGRGSFSKPQLITALSALVVAKPIKKRFANHRNKRRNERRAAKMKTTTFKA